MDNESSETAPRPPITRRRLLKLGVIAGVATVLGGQSDRPDNISNVPKLHSESQAQQRILEIERRYKVKVYAPRQMINVDESFDALARRDDIDPLTNPFTGIIEGTPPRARVMQALQYIGQEAKDDPAGYVDTQSPSIHEPTPDSIDTIEATLSILPTEIIDQSHLKGGSENLVEIYIVTGPVQKRDEHIKIPDDEKVFPASAPWRGYCECKHGAFFDRSTDYEPSVLVDKILVDNGNIDDTRIEGVRTLAHELVHTYVESFNVRGGANPGSMINHINNQALATLGFNVFPDQELDRYYFPMIEKLDTTGDIETARGASNEITGHAWRSRLGYIGESVSELVPRSADMFLDGKDYFISEFSRVFGPTIAEEYYNFIRDEVFKGREFTPHSIADALESLSK